MTTKENDRLPSDASIINLIDTIENVNSILNNSISKLKNNLSSKNISCNGDDKFITLASKIKDIESIEKADTLPAWIKTYGDIWIECAPMPTARNLLAAASVGTKIYCMGGNTSTGNYAQVATNECYDTVSNTWEKKANMLSATIQFTAQSIDTKIYCLGRYVYGNTNVCYDTVTDTWSTKTGITTGRGYSSSAKVDNKIYVIGGYSAYNTATSKNECYDPTTDTWTTKANASASRQKAVAVGVGNIVYYVGGVDGTHSNYYATTYAYDTVTNTWTTKASLPEKKASAMGACLNEALYVSMGVDNNFLYSRNHSYTTYTYDANNNTWIKVNGAPTKISSAGFCVNDNALYVFGGEDGDYIYAGSYAYIPQGGQ